MKQGAWRGGGGRAGAMLAMLLLLGVAAAGVGASWNHCAQFRDFDIANSYELHVEMGGHGPGDHEDSLTHHIGGAARICMMTLEPGSDSGSCKEGFSFGIDNEHPGIWVSDGCEGKFKVDFAPGKCESVLLSSSPSVNATFVSSGVIYSVNVIRDHDTAVRCTQLGEDWTFGYTTHEVTARGGCDADFEICHSQVT